MEDDLDDMHEENELDIEDAAVEMGELENEDVPDWIDDDVGELDEDDNEDGELDEDDMLDEENEPYVPQDVIALLRDNNPQQTLVELKLRYFTDDNELSEALQANNHVNNIHLDLRGMDLVDLRALRLNSLGLEGLVLRGFDSLKRALATRENLEKVHLNDDSDYDWRIHFDRVTPFLLAIQENHRVQTVDLERLQLSGESLATFVDNATSVTKLSLSFCGMKSLADAHTIAAALQRNTNIRHLELFSDLEQMYMIPIFNSLTSNTSVNALKLGVFPIQSLDVILAAKNLLETTSTIQRFEFSYGRMSFDEDTFRPMAQGLIQSKSVTDVTFGGCSFYYQEVVLLLNDVLESKSNLQRFALKNCSVHQPWQESFHAAIFGLLQPHSLLRSFELDCNNLSDYGFETAQDCARLLTAVQTSSLERFSIGTITSRASCLLLIASIPRMLVGTLEFRLNRHLQDLTGDILRSIQQNSSLRTVVAKGDDSADWFNEDDEMIVSSYSARNESFARWIENPTGIPEAAWSEALNATQMIGLDAAFRILRALAPSLGFFVG
jgi:hypothetical protein